MDKKEFRDLWYDDQLEKVYEELDDSWRHGNNVYAVFAAPNGTYWAANYQVSGDSEYHGIRENDFEFSRVYPKTVVETKTEWVTQPPNPNVFPKRYVRKFHEVEAAQYPQFTDPNRDEKIDHYHFLLDKVGGRGDMANVVPGDWLVNTLEDGYFFITDTNFKKFFEPT